MQKTTSVYRYELPLGAKKIQLPKGAVILEVLPAATEPKFHVFTLVDTTATMEDRYFALIKTGEMLPDGIWDARHLLTLKGGHLFEVSADLAVVL